MPAMAVDVCGSAGPKLKGSGVVLVEVGMNSAPGPLCAACGVAPVAVAAFGLCAGCVLALRRAAGLPATTARREGLNDGE